MLGLERRLGKLNGGVLHRGTGHREQTRPDPAYSQRDKKFYTFLKKKAFGNLLKYMPFCVLSRQQPLF